METAQTAPLANDVLHNEHHSTLTPEEIAKALAHHKKHHTGDAQKAEQNAKKKHK